MDNELQQFTREELTTLFHVMNNAYGDAWEKAAERASECDGMAREDFVRTYSRLITKLANMA